MSMDPWITQSDTGYGAEKLPFCRLGGAIVNMDDILIFHFHFHMVWIIVLLT